MKLGFKITTFQLACMVMISSCSQDMVCESIVSPPICESFTGAIYICQEEESAKLPGCHLETVCDGGVGNDSDSGNDVDGGARCKEICVGSLVSCKELSKNACKYARHCEWRQEDDNVI